MNSKSGLMRHVKKWKISLNLKVAKQVEGPMGMCIKRVGKMGKSDVRNHKYKPVNHTDMTGQ